jgi:thiol:disulfide interchange protein DsbD
MGGMPSMAAVASAEAGSDVWEEFSEERVAELRAQGVPVFIDFTAKWCLICQANHLVMTTDEVAQQFSEKGVVKMKADWTKSDPAITKELRKFGRNSVPLYVLYDKTSEGSPQILPQVLTPETLIDALAQIE